VFVLCSTGRTTPICSHSFLVAASILRIIPTAPIKTRGQVEFALSVHMMVRTLG
jgi:hypothetical protein